MEIYTPSLRSMNNRERCQDAALFVLQSLESIPLSVTWNAALCGGVICDPNFVVSGTGVCIKYQSALQSQRLLWMTERFIRSHGHIADATIHRTLQGIQC